MAASFGSETFIVMPALVLAGLLNACGLRGGDASLYADPCDAEQVGLIITELMANPAGPDAGKEWLELLNMGDTPLCLDGAVLHVGLPWASKSRTLSQVGCIPPHSFWVLADGHTAPGGPPPYAVHHRYGAMPMPNTQGTVAISCRGAVLAAVEYGAGDVPAPVSGRALARVPMAPWGQFCVVAGAADSQGNVGSPGAANPGCNTCIDSSGAQRPVADVPPGALSLQALHVPARAARKRDIGADEDTAPPLSTGPPWGQMVLQAGDEAVDLAGLTLEAVSGGGKSRMWRMPEGQCHTIAPGTSVAVPLMHHHEAAEGRPAWLGRLAPTRSDAVWTLRQGDVALFAVDGRALGAAG